MREGGKERGRVEGREREREGGKERGRVEGRESEGERGDEGKGEREGEKE